MAPEQICGTPQVSHRTDLYALGVVLYRMLTSEIPMTTVGPLMHPGLTESKPRPRVKVTEIPVALDELVVKLMAKGPADRPQNAAAVGAALIKLRDKQKLVEPMPMETSQPRNVLVDSVQEGGLVADFGLAVRLDDVARRIDRFRTAWYSDQRPKIEDYLAESPQSEHPSLLRELLTLELELRRSHGELPTVEGYRKRFPGYPEIIAGAFGNVAVWIDELKRGDELAARKLWQHYSEKLLALSRRHFSRQGRSVIDEEDVVQTAFAKFLSMAAQGRLPEDVTADEIWKLLVRITMRELVDCSRRHFAACRDVRRERDHVDPSEDTSLAAEDHFDLDVCERVSDIDVSDRLNQLPEDLRQIVEWKLEGYTNAEIADRLGLATRTVERRMQRVREILREEFDQGRSSRKKPPVSSPQRPPFIRRHTDVSFPARVRQGKAYHLRVQIVPAEVVLRTGEISEIPRPHSHDATMVLKVPEPTESKSTPIKVEISVAAENFEIEGSPHAELVVPLEGTSRPVSFRLRGELVGPGRIMVDFCQGGRPVGSVDLYPEIIAADPREEPRPVPAKEAVELSLGPALAAPDLVIKVFEHRFADQAGRLQYIVSSTLSGLRDLPVLDGDFGTIELKTDVAAWVEQRLQSVGSLAHRDDMTAEQVSRALAGVGHNLFDQLFPKTLQDLCWTIRGRDVRTILILSDEPHIPWELIKPYRDNPQTGEFEEGEFWGQSYALTHWLRGRPPVRRLSFNRICALAAAVEGPPGGEAKMARDMVPVVPAPASMAEQSARGSPVHLVATNEELEVLRSFEATGSRVRFLPARRLEILGVLEQGEFDLFHLISHGEFAGPVVADASAVLVEDGTFRVAELTPGMAEALRRAAPLIFFNSCHSGRTGFSLTRLGSWAAQFVHLGCGGFVGTLWQVTDRAASAFAQAFYEGMRQGLPIGEVMLRARQHVRDRYPNDPTWLAYCCFADPMARVET
jgi:RNA polymerase sigma factor (sigma-70 family)